MKKVGNFSGLFILIAFMFFSCKREVIAPPAPDEPNPIADFTIQQSGGAKDPFSFKFDNHSMDFKKIRWEFGDDSSSVEPSPVHTFLKAGNFTVKLRTTNSTGNWAQKEAVIKIVPDAIIDLKANPVGNGTLDLTLQTAIDVASLFWYKGVGSTKVFIGKDPKINIKLKEGEFQDYTLEVQTPKGSKIFIERLLTNIGVVKDVTNIGRLVVSRDNASGATANEGSLKLTDGNVASSFYMKDSMSPWIGDFWFQLEFNEPQNIKAYTFTSSPATQNRDPFYWNVKGSMDGKTWTEVDKVDNFVFTARGQTKMFSVKNPGAYTYYRVNVTKIWGPFDIFQLAEWRVLGFPTN